MICDAFINGLTSPGIRQRLLEHRELNLETAVEKARAVELAQRTVNIILNLKTLFDQAYLPQLYKKNWKLKTLIVKLLLPNHPLLFTSHQRPPLA